MIISGEVGNEEVEVYMGPTVSRQEKSEVWTVDPIGFPLRVLLDPEERAGEYEEMDLVSPI